MSSKPHYTAEEDAIIIASYPTMSTRDMWKQFLPHRSLKGINIRAWKLGLRKEPEARDFGIKVTTMISHMPPTEISYLAGIFDGEGCLHMRVADTGVCRFYATITTTSKILLAWLEARLPGKAYLCTKRKQRPTHKPAWTWSIPGNRRVIVFSREIAPHLTIKRRQAELIAGGYIRLDHAARLAMSAQLSSMKRTD